MDKVNEMLVKMLKSIDIFKWFDDELVLQFSGYFKLTFVQEWSTIIREWEIPDNVYILKNGNLEVRKSKWLSHIKLWNIELWHVFGEMSFFTKSKAIASVVVDWPNANIWEISRENFKIFLDAHPKVSEDIEKSMKERDKKIRKYWVKHTNQLKW